MEFSKILFERSGDVAIIRLNAPEVLNALDVPMVQELNLALDEACRSSRAVVLTGEGRAFSAGANLGGGIAATGEDGLHDAGLVLETDINPMMVKISRLPIPLITSVRGAAAGVGCSFALVGDIIVASESAFFLQAFCRIGLVPDGGSSWLLTRAVGRPRAMEMMLLGERITAAKALEWGLINRLTTEEELEGTTMALAHALAAAPTRSLGMIREVAWTAADTAWPEVLATERRLQREAGRTGDHQEGIDAFRDKRPPHFTGA